MEEASGETASRLLFDACVELAMSDDTGSWTLWAASFKVVGVEHTGRPLLLVADDTLDEDVFIDNSVAYSPETSIDASCSLVMGVFAAV